MRRIRRLAGLPAAERRLLLTAALVHAALRLALVLLPFVTVQRLCGCVATARPRGLQAPAARIVWAVETSARHAGRGSCLTQALAAHVLLTRHGHPARLRIGVALDTRQKLSAHAWVESEGVVLVGAPPEGRYRPLLDLEMAPR